VVLRRSGELVTAELVVEGGLRNTRPQLAGAEGLLWHFLLRGGTRSLDADAFAAAQEKAAARMGFALHPDYTSLHLTCLRSEFASAWALFAEAVFAPAWDANAFERARHEYASQRIAGLDPGWDKADSAAAHHFFADHLYARSTQGAYRTLADLPLDTLRDLHARIVVPQRLRLVVTGDLTGDEVALLAAPALATLAPAERPEPVAPWPQPAAQPNYVRADSLPLSYVVGNFRAPAPTTEGAVELELALRMLQRRLVQDVCLRRNLTCEVGAQLHPTAQGYGSVFFATALPNPTIKAVVDLLAASLASGFNEAELAEARRELLGQLYQNVESDKGMTAALARAAAFGHVEAFLRKPERIATAKLADVNRVYKQHLNSIAWTFYGDTRNVGRGVFTR
jgi:zinc protease